jgi:plasmid maintenance system antidote protein VapI
VRRATLSDLVNCHAALSPEMALRIEKAFGVNMDMLLQMQAWFDTYTMRQRAGEIDVKPFNPPGPREGNLREALTRTVCQAPRRAKRRAGRSCR